ncbi:hypothetical protein WS7_06210 [Xanthomonas citri pv. malvacearum str. GSPB2388]|uniref:hypothetical protein n=1 Tax=Xanthomonas citri TaxID=346 RepID=UPI0002981D3F|nr:hypothetical protein [Xanthomonas citri]EKQ61981.1 hypothetical protein WS7_06210 [Xanthomonas citri pv. malvacearum str. GSPB2388]
MSANSIRDVEKALLKRYRVTYGQSDATFLAGFGVSWAKLKDTVDREAAAERAELAAKQSGKKVRSVAIPYTAEECAGLLKLPYKTFNELARADGSSGRLVPEEAPGRSRKVAAISLARLLEWAEGVPRARDWRTSRKDGEILGATKALPEIRSTFQELKHGKVKVVLTDQEGTEVVAWLDLEQSTSSARAMLKAFLREQAKVVEVDARGFAALSQQELTIPWAFSLPWANPTLRAALLILYIQFLTQLEALLAQRESEALEEIKELRARLDVIEDAAKTITLLKAEIRAAAMEASIPASTRTPNTRPRF